MCLFVLNGSIPKSYGALLCVLMHIHEVEHCCTGFDVVKIYVTKKNHVTFHSEKSFYSIFFYWNTGRVFVENFDIVVLFLSGRKF